MAVLAAFPFVWAAARAPPCFPAVTPCPLRGGVAVDCDPPPSAGHVEDWSRHGERRRCGSPTAGSDVVVPTGLDATNSCHKPNMCDLGTTTLRLHGALCALPASDRLKCLRLPVVPETNNLVDMALLNLRFGRIRAAALLARGQPKLLHFVNRWADALDTWASFQPEPGECSLEVRRDGCGFIEQFDGAYQTPDGGKIGFRALLAWSAPMEETPLVLHFHGTTERALDYTEPSQYHVLHAKLRLGQEKTCFPEDVNEMHLAALRDFLGLRARAGVEFAGVPASVIFVDFRGFGWSSEQCRLSALCDDAEALVEALPDIVKRLGLPWPYPGPVVVMGKSAGTIAAVHLASVFGSSTVEGLVLDASIGCHWPFEETFRGGEGAYMLLDELLADLAALEGNPLFVPAAVSSGDVFGGRFCCQCCGRLDALEHGSGTPTASAIAKRSLLFLDSTEKLTLYDGPTLVIHSPDDPVCPWPQAEAMFDAARGDRKRLLRLEGAGHHNFSHPDFWPELGKFLRHVAAAKIKRRSMCID